MLLRKKKTKEERSKELAESLGSFALKIAIRRTVNNEQNKLRLLKEQLGLLKEHRDTYIDKKSIERKLKINNYLIPKRSFETRAY